MRAIGNAVGVGLVLLFVAIMIVGAIQTAFFPREKTPEELARDAAYAAAQGKAVAEEAVRRAEREAHAARVSECLGAGAESLSPQLFSAMLDRCERHARLSASREEAVEASLKEKWNASPLYPDDQ